MSPLELIFEDEELASLELLLAGFRDLDRNGQRPYARQTREGLLRMILTGGLMMVEEHDSVDPQPVPPHREPVETRPGELTQVAALVSKLGITHDEVMRLVTLDGLAYVNTALSDFRGGADVSLPPGQ